MEVIRNFVANTVGIEHEEFLKLSTDNHIEAWGAIRRLTLGAELLVNCVSHETVIVRLDRYGETHWENNYGAIGDGSEVARAFLCLQPWHSDSGHEYYTGKVPLAECLYRIYEAKCAAHKANPSSVGQSTSFQVLTKNGRFILSGKMWKAIDELFEEKHRVPNVAAKIKDIGDIIKLHEAFPIGTP
jgi:hypothetical protein